MIVELVIVVFKIEHVMTVQLSYSAIGRLEVTLTWERVEEEEEEEGEGEEEKEKEKEKEKDKYVNMQC